MCLILAACSNDSYNKEVESSSASAPVTVRVDGFSISQEDFPSTTRATAVGSYNGIQKLTLAFYASNGTEVYKATQSKNEADFGEFSTFLPICSYTMVVLGYVLYDDDELTLTSPTQAEYTGGCIRETFAATQAVNITNTNAVNLTATLNRIIACLQVLSTDGRTANVNKVRMTFAAGGKRFSPTSGLATVNTGSVSTVGNSATVGTTSTSKGYVFLASDEQIMDVTIEALDAESAVLFSKTVNKVPFKRNRVTKLTGAIYAADANASGFQVNTTWLDEEDPIAF